MITFAGFHPKCCLGATVSTNEACLNVTSIKNIVTVSHASFPSLHADFGYWGGEERNQCHLRDSYQF